MGKINLLLGCSIFALVLAVSPGQQSIHLPASSSTPKLTSSSRTAASVDDSAADSRSPSDSADAPDPDAIRRARLFAQEARKKNIADSEKLVALARELSAEYDKPVPPEVSSNQFNKVKEIEKLAKRVKQRLSQQ